MGLVLPRDIPGQYHIGTRDYLYGTAEGYPGTVPFGTMGQWDLYPICMRLPRNILGQYHIGTMGLPIWGYPGTVPLIWDYGTVGLISNLYGTAEGYPGTIPYWDYGTTYMGLLRDIPEQYHIGTMGQWNL